MTDTINAVNVEYLAFRPETHHHLCALAGSPDQMPPGWYYVGLWEGCNENLVDPVGPFEDLEHARRDAQYRFAPAAARLREAGYNPAGQPLWRVAMAADTPPPYHEHDPLDLGDVHDHHPHVPSDAPQPHEHGPVPEPSPPYIPPDVPPDNYVPPIPVVEPPPGPPGASRPPAARQVVMVRLERTHNAAPYTQAIRAMVAGQQARRASWPEDDILKHDLAASVDGNGPFRWVGSGTGYYSSLEDCSADDWFAGVPDAGHPA